MIGPQGDLKGITSQEPRLEGDMEKADSKNPVVTVR